LPKRYPLEKRLEVVLAGLRSEDSIREVCRQHGIETKTYYKWKNAFVAGGKAALNGDETEAVDTRARELEGEIKRLKELVADLSIENHLLKKSE
jgi:transposase